MSPLPMSWYSVVVLLHQAALVAAGMGAIVTTDLNPNQFGVPIPLQIMLQLACQLVQLKTSTKSYLVIGAVLVPGSKAIFVPNYRKLLRSMQKGAVLIDVAVDQGLMKRPPNYSRKPYVRD